MGLADRVATYDERNRLLVVHRHAAEGLPDVLAAAIGSDCRRPLRVHVDEPICIGAPKGPASSRRRCSARL